MFKKIFAFFHFKGGSVPPMAPHHRRWLLGINETGRVSLVYFTTLSAVNNPTDYLISELVSLPLDEKVITGDISAVRWEYEPEVVRLGINLGREEYILKFRLEKLKALATGQTT